MTELIIELVMLISFTTLVLIDAPMSLIFYAGVVYLGFVMRYGKDGGRA